MDIIIKIFSLFAAVVLHEVAHGYAAYRLGDPTARDANRLTLNPAAHVDLVGTIILPAFLVMVRSPVLFGWAKPVPFNPSYFRDQQMGIMIVGAAGPATNLLVAFIAGFLFRVLGLTPEGLAGAILIYLCLTNVILGVFNLVPIPPLDGSRVVIGLLPRDLVPGYLRLERAGFIIIFALLWLGALDYIIYPVIRFTLMLLLGG